MQQNTAHALLQVWLCRSACFAPCVCADSGNVDYLQKNKAKMLLGRYPGCRGTRWGLSGIGYGFFCLFVLTTPGMPVVALLPQRRLFIHCTRIAKGAYPIPGTGVRARVQNIVGPASVATPSDHRLGRSVFITEMFCCFLTGKLRAGRRLARAAPAANGPQNMAGWTMSSDNTPPCTRRDPRSIDPWAS